MKESDPPFLRGPISEEPAYLYQLSVFISYPPAPRQTGHPSKLHNRNMWHVQSPGTWTCSHVRWAQTFILVQTVHAGHLACCTKTAKGTELWADQDINVTSGKEVVLSFCTAVGTAWFPGEHGNMADSKMTFHAFNRINMDQKLSARLNLHQVSQLNRSSVGCLP